MMAGCEAWLRGLGAVSVAAVPVGGGRAWPGFEPTRRAKLAARTVSGRAAAHGHTEQPGKRERAAASSVGRRKVQGFDGRFEGGGGLHVLVGIRVFLDLARQNTG